jgi:DNA repair exonuclease SbcCD ATPase subunit
LKIDSTTLKASIDKVIEDGKRKGQELSAGRDELKKLGEIEFSVNVYDKKVEDKGKCEAEIVRIRSEYTHITQKIEALTKGEYCPTCGKKLDNVDNSAKIAELKEENQKNIVAGRKLKEEKEKLEKEISDMKENRDKFQKASELKVRLAALETQVEKLRAEYKEQNTLYKEYLKNNDAIDKNNQIDIEVRNTESALQNKRNSKDTNVRFINENDSKVARHKEEIDTRKKIISKIKEEEKQVKNWKIYLDMVGKNGVSKMVLRKTLPVINAHLSKMLNDVCDFDIEVAITDSNDVVFYIIKDGIRSDLAGGSGFESTVAALALRIVLANISTIPRVNFVVMDEVLGRVAKENYENMHGLYNKILENYDFIIQISHLDEIKDWHSTILTIKKENNVSTINVSTNNIV